MSNSRDATNIDPHYQAAVRKGLRNLIGRKDWKEGQFAEAMGLNNATALSRRFGDTPFSEEEISAAAKALKATPDEIMALGVRLIAAEEEAAEQTNPGVSTLAGRPQGWTFRMTDLFASQDVKASLVSSGNRSALAIDDGVMLCLAAQPFKEVVHRCEVPPGMDTTDLEKEEIADINRFLDDGWSAEIIDHLKLHAAKANSADYECKVALKGFDPPATRSQAIPGLRLSPVNWWVTFNFNRLALFPAPPPLLELHARGRQQILRLGSSGTVPFPSTLHLEMAVVTKDRHLVIVEKMSGPSQAATTGRRQSCTFEVAFRWNAPPMPDRLGIEEPLRAALREKLDLDYETVTDWGLFGIALEHPHLNTAMLGWCSIDLTAEALSTHLSGLLQRPGAVYRSARPVPLETARREFASPGPSADWHMTARLRMWLTSLAIEGKRLDSDWVADAAAP